MSLRVLRVYHAARDSQQHGREHALAAAGVDLTLVVPSAWPNAAGDLFVTQEAFRVIEMPVQRAGDVNRHSYFDNGAMRQLVTEVRPDVVDIHEEPFSVAARQWLNASPKDLPVVMYTAQNVDKRLPPPFSRYERAAHRRVAAFYPCSRQAASVLRGKGFAGAIEVLPLAYDDTVFTCGAQSLDDDEVVLMLAGRLVPEKGIDDAIRTLVRVNAVRPARLVVSGRGSEETPARRLAASLGVVDRVEFRGWQSGRDLAITYQAAHIVLVPSRPTATWVEQFGRVIVEAQASGAVVASYASGSIPEVGGEAAVVVPTGEAEQLADAVADLVLDRYEFARRRDAGLRQAATRTWPVVAKSQVALYQAALEDRRAHHTLSPSPSRRRAAARAEFGPTAATLGGLRPFALPLLRRGALAHLLATAIDGMSEFASRSSR
jgi:glycosyltransferase involved in cell wall biosynthesis